MLLLKSSLTSVFMGSILPHIETMKGDMKAEPKPLNWDSERSVHNISRCASANRHPRLRLFRDLADSEHRSDTEDYYRYSSLQLGPNGVPLFCTSRGCRPAHVSESDYMTGGSGIKRRGKNWEAAEDQSSKSSTDMYYQRMLEANPGNPLLFSNYAKFLHEVQHNMAKAEEYYGRAILASPGDAEVLSLYANFIWETHKDAVKAQAYFDQAVKAAPDNCYILSSYAHFLWQSQEDEEDAPLDLQNVAAPICVGYTNNEAVI